MAQRPAELQLPRLPLEVMGLILLNLDFEELKKCRLISSRWYKAVQDVFQDQYFNKGVTRFCGWDNNFTLSCNFGINIFGTPKLNFGTLRVHRALYYLMKTWLEKLDFSNLQKLELSDNTLDWKEVIKVLKYFDHIVHFKFVQSSRSMNRARKILSLYEIEYKTDEKKNRRGKIREQFTRGEIFLPNLKTFEIEVVHIEVLNFMSTILTFSKCKLENFIIKFDLRGLYQVVPLIYTGSYKLKKGPMKMLRIESLNHMKKFSKTLRCIKIAGDESKLAEIFKSHRALPISVEFAKFKLGLAVLKMFEKPEKLQMFNKIESLIINIPVLHLNLYRGLSNGLNTFIKGQKNLDRLHISFIDDLAPNKQSLADPSILTNRVRTYLKDLADSCSRTTFGYTMTSLPFGFVTLVDFTEQLTNLKIFLTCESPQWKFSDVNIPIFPNCKELRLESELYRRNWTDFQVSSIITKFPNVERFTIYSQHTYINISNEDMQLIIMNWKNIKSLFFQSCTKDLDDTGLTGLTRQAVTARTKNNKSLRPIGPKERTGLPISHLKKLESLVIRAKYDPIHISDLSIRYGFDDMKNLKNIHFYYTDVTQAAPQLLKEKTGKFSDLKINFEAPELYSISQTTFT